MTHPASHASPVQRGYTLIELMIGLLIAAVLATVAWPRLTQFIQRARRSEAHTALTEVLNAQSRYRSSHPHYARSLGELGLGASPLQHYRLLLLDLPATDDEAPDAEPFTRGFVLKALPLHTSSQAQDHACAELRLTLNGRQLIQSAKTADGRSSVQCWPQ